jgi:hypothetical protein
LGDYTRIYPFPHTETDGSTPEQREKWDMYEAIRAHAREVWVKQTGVNNIKEGQEKKELMNAAALGKDGKKPFSFGGAKKQAQSALEVQPKEKKPLATKRPSQ